MSRRKPVWSLVYGAVRIAFVLVLCIFSAADDLTDLFSGALHCSPKAPQQVRTASQSDDDSEDHHHVVGAESGHFVVAADYSSTVVNEFLIATSTPTVVGTPRAVSGGRAPPQYFL